MGRKLTSYDVAILRAALPVELALDAVPPKTLGAAMVAWGNNPKAKIRGRTKLGESAAVFVETETGGELISFWNGSMKELSFVPTELARRAVADFRQGYRGAKHRQGVFGWILIHSLMAPVVFIWCLPATWSFLKTELGSELALLLVFVPIFCFALFLEYMYDQITYGFARVRNRDQYLVKKYLREIEPSIAKSTAGFFRRIFGRGKK